VSEDLGCFNALPSTEAAEMLLPCCGSRVWARQVAKGRPYKDLADLRERSDEIWRRLGREDWREAFAAHPRIGEKATGWSEKEQVRARGADKQTVAELIEANRDYETRFDHIFIVCATGKSAAEMLALLRARLGNDPETELRIAAEEQRKITNLRLEKLFS
jgi:OHCU decarboxylase